MSFSYNTISLSSTRPFLFAGAGGGPNNFNRQAAAMIPRPNAVAPPPRRRRNQPGNPHPDAEVIALTPEEITATHRFLCEVYNTRFNREQNLQLHRRGHNLSWTLKLKSNTDVRRKVYVCPVINCVHHDPSRALGDLTGIKKHYLRKHGEKKWQCEKCPKRYAVLSDWKAHNKICGTKNYRCDCGTIFSRRDSFISHRAFCDALIRETSRNPVVSFTAMAAAAGGGRDRHDFYGGALSRSHFGNSNSGFTPQVVGYNLNRSISPIKYQDFVPHQPTNLNPTATNFFNFGYFGQDNTNNYNSDQSNFPSLFTNADVDNNDPSSLLRGLSSSPPSSVKFFTSVKCGDVVVNDFGDDDNGNLLDLINNSIAGTQDHHQGRSRLTLDFLGPYHPFGNAG